jgi:hypothetical protein
LLERYKGLTPNPVRMHELFPAIEIATRRNERHRDQHDRHNRNLLGIPEAPTDDEAANQRKREYDALTGRDDRVGDFINWFSHISHDAFVAQRLLPYDRQFKHVSLELGGVFQLGNWGADSRIENMAKSIPAQVIEAVPDLNRMTVYGQKWMDQIDDKRITYKDVVPNSYTLFPRYVDKGEAADAESVGKVAFDYTVIRRRSPLVDIYFDNEDEQSDVVVFGDRTELVVMPLIDEDIREAIVEDSQHEFEKRKGDHKGLVKLQDTAAAKMVGKLMEIAKASPYGQTKNMVPVSSHYVQGVGDKFGKLREEFTS